MNVMSDNEASAYLFRWIAGRCEFDAQAAEGADKAHLLWVAHYYRERLAAVTSSHVARSETQTP